MRDEDREKKAGEETIIKEGQGRYSDRDRDRDRERYRRRKRRGGRERESSCFLFSLWKSDQDKPKKAHINREKWSLETLMKMWFFLGGCRRAVWAESGLIILVLWGGFGWRTFEDIFSIFPFSFSFSLSLSLPPSLSLLWFFFYINLGPAGPFLEREREMMCGLLPVLERRGLWE